MFNSSLIGDSSKVSARRSSFSQTCALLSRYVKENKAFGDLSFDMAAEIDGRDSNKAAFTQTTMNLFPVNEIAEEVPKKDKSVSSAEYIPDSSGINSAPLTIFYGGQVIVVNDFPSHKMKEIMQLANDNYSHNRINLSMSKNMLDLNPTVQEVAPKTIISDLPQKRRASLQRFMGKRKERVAAKAPYSMNKPENAESKLKQNENNPWLELASAGAALR
ncbi:hypothetical protein V2J09_012409 [Rumex salicifolius]